MEKASIRCWDVWPRDGIGKKCLFAGGLLARVPREPSVSKLMPEEDIQYYVQQFKKSGFR